MPKPSGSIRTPVRPDNAKPSEPSSSYSFWGGIHVPSLKTLPSKLLRLTSQLFLLRGSRRIAACSVVLTLIWGIWFLSAGSLDALTQNHQRKAKSSKPMPAPCREGCNPDAPVLEPNVAVSPEDEAARREMTDLARSLRNGTPGSYEKLAAFAKKNDNTIWGARAALALGAEDYEKKRAQQALSWLTKANSDTLLGDQVLYYTAQTQHALKRNGDALNSLETLLHDYPATPIKEQVLEALGSIAIDAHHLQVAIDALEAYAATPSKPNLLLVRAQVYRLARQTARAVKDYQTIFYKFPLADEAKPAGIALPQLTRQLSKEYPYPGVELQEQRAQAFFDAHKWKEARTEFEKLLTMLKDPGNPHRQLAQLRGAQARVHLKGPASLVASLTLTDSDVDAERLFVISQIYRDDKKESEMLAAIEQLLQKYPTSKWAEDGLMAQGNYYWVELDRDKAAASYQRLLDNFPNGRYAFNCDWRIAWVSYLERRPEASEKFTAFLRKYPVSSNAPNALYWLGRIAERENKREVARALYRAATERFPETYFGLHSAARLESLGEGDDDPPEFLATIPPPPPLRPFDEPIAATAMDRWNRAEALRSIGFDAAAESELKSAYYASGSPRLLFEAAQAAFDQGHFGTGMSYGRLIVPNFDARKFSDVPLIIWKTLYPLPYEATLRREAAKNNFDPMLAAGLIRQESTFQADAVSRKDAVGLMQVLPKTGRLMSKHLKLRYAKTKLYEPDFNIEVGMVYVANLLRDMGAPEYALAAFNAGEDRIALWRSERKYEEIPELVESIPFTETRDYVQIVLRNAEVYRMIYGATPPLPSVAVAATSASAGSSKPSGHN
jgi:soluble lytic murein transglycosylase